MLEKFKFWRKPEKAQPQKWGKETLKKPKLKPRKKTRKQRKKQIEKDIFTDLKHGKSNKIRIPGLKTFNQVFLVVFLILNFFISQAALISMTPSMFFIFFGNSYAIFYGLWKSRTQREKLTE